MMEMEMENERINRLHLRQFGEDWIRAIIEGTLDQLARFCHPDVVSHILTSKRYVTYDNDDALVAKIKQWFGECSDFRLEHSRVEPVGERLGIFYRLLLRERGRWYIVEQQLYCTLQNRHITQLHLLCSGFQPVWQYGENETQAPAQDSLLVIHTTAANSVSTCALLTPSIKVKLRDMQSGQVLEVIVDDPSAKGDIEAWCRLSGNALVRMEEIEGSQLRFFVKKK